MEYCQHEAVTVCTHLGIGFDYDYSNKQFPHPRLQLTIIFIIDSSADKFLFLSIK